MAGILNPKYAMTFVGGPVNAANLAAGGGFLPIVMADTHYLPVVAGGTMAAGPLPNTCVSDWRMLEVAYASVASVLAIAPTLAQLIHDIVFPELDWASGLLQAADAAGFLDWSVRSSLAEAVAVMVRGLTQHRTSAPNLWVADATRFVQLPPDITAAQIAALPADEQYIYSITLGMLVQSSSGEMHGLAVFSMICPGRTLQAMRTQEAFVDTVLSLSTALESQRAGFLGRNNRIKAREAGSFILSTAVVGSEYLVAVPPQGAFAVTTRLGPLAASEQNFPGYFHDAWPGCAPNLALLMPSTTGNNAFAFVSQMIGAAPTPAKVRALDEQVRSLMPLLEADAPPGQPVAARVTLMAKLLSEPRKADDPKSGSRGIDSAGWADIWNRPINRTLNAQLQAANTLPLVEYRVARILLSSDSALAILMLLKKVRPQNKLCKDISGAFIPSAIHTVFRRDIFTTGAGAAAVVKTEFFAALKTETIDKIVAGDWAPGSGLDIFGDILYPVICTLQEAPQFFDQHMPNETLDLFVDEWLLEKCTETLVAVFRRINLGGGGPNSLHSLLTTFAANVRRWNKFGADDGAIRSIDSLRLLQKQAALVAFREASIAWKDMLSLTPDVAVRPLEFAPTSGGAQAVLAQVDEQLARCEVERKRQATELGVSAVVHFDPGRHGYRPTSPTASSASGASSSRPLGLSGVSMRSTSPSRMSAVSFGQSPNDSVSQIGVTQPYNNLARVTGYVASSTGGNDAERIATETGSKVSEVKAYGNGFMFEGNVFGGPKDPDLTLQNSSPCWFAPNHKAHMFCPHPPGVCTHSAPPGVETRIMFGRPADQQGNGQQGYGKWQDKPKGGKGQQGSKGKGKGKPGNKRQGK